MKIHSDPVNDFLNFQNVGKFSIMSGGQILRTPPNGVWKGYYKQNRRQNEFQMNVNFSNDGFVIGSGLDKDFCRWNSNGFDAIGHWKPFTFEITFTKSYRSQHGIYYSGTVSFDDNQAKMKGHWKQSWHGNFEDEFFLTHIEQPDEEILERTGRNEAIDTSVHLLKSDFIQNLKEFHQETNTGTIDAFYDFKIFSEIDKISVNCNKILLAMQSSYFSKKFQEAPSTEHELVCFSHECIQVCIGMLYTGDVSLTEKNVEDVLELSDKLQLNVIKEIAVDFILDGICQSNCIKILVLGDKFGNQRMITKSIQVITKNLDEIEAKYCKDLYQIPLHLFQKILESDGLILRNKKTGIIWTGLARELSIISLLDRYIRLHPELNENETSISCIRLPQVILNSFSKNTLAAGLDLKFDENLVEIYNARIKAKENDTKESEWEDIMNKQENARNDKETRTVTLLSSQNEFSGKLKIDLDLEELSKWRQRLLNVIESTSEKCLKMLRRISSDCETDDTLNNDVQMSPSPFDRKLSKLTCFSTLPIGNIGIHTYVKSPEIRVTKLGIIRKIRIHSSLMRGQNVERWQANDHQIILKGLEFRCHENSEPYSIGLSDREGTFIDDFELEEGEHISMVKGRSAEFILQLCFVTNKGRMLKMGGNQCSRMGDEFSTLTYVRRNTPQDEMIPLQHMYLNGISGNVVETRDGFSAMAQVQFCMGMITDNSVIFRPPKHDLAIHALRSLHY